MKTLAKYGPIVVGILLTVVGLYAYLFLRKDHSEILALGVAGVGLILTFGGHFLAKRFAPAVDLYEKFKAGQPVEPQDAP